MSELNLQELIQNEIKKALEGVNKEVVKEIDPKDLKGNQFIDITNRIKEHEKKIEQKTISVKEFSQILGCSYQKALRLVHHEKCPCFRVGTKGYRIIISKIDTFLDELIGVEL